MLDHARQQQRAADSGADAQHERVVTRVDRAELAGRHLDVGEHGVDLPRLAVGRVDPHLVLDREAARDLVLGRGRETLVARGVRARPATSSVDSHLDAEVVQRSGRACALDEHQLQRRLGDREVRVPGAELGRLGREELRVEADGGVEVRRR